MRVPEAISHILTVVSHDPDASLDPSGEKAIQLIRFEWPVKIAVHAPEAVSQIRAVSSSDPDASFDPSGEKAAELTHSECPSSTETLTPGFTSRKRMLVALRVLDAHTLPSDETARLAPEPIGLSNAAVHVSDPTSQTRMASSLEPDVRFDPSGRNARDVTGLEWPLSIAVQTPEPELQSRTVQSSDPDANCAPSREYFRTETSSV